MIRVLSRCAATFALLVVTAAQPGPALAADPIDLKVESATLFVNASGQVNDRVVRFKVTNVGTQNAPASTGKLEVLAPGPAQEQALAVPAIARNNSFEGFAQLPASCNGHIVRVTIAAPGETNLTDNSFGPVKLCAETSQAPPELDIVTQIPGTDVRDVLPPDLDIVTQIPGTDVADLMLPEHLRPGRHELMFEPTALRQLSRSTYRGVHAGPLDDISDPDWMHVGWDANLSYNDFQVWETAVNFDLAKLLEVPRPFVEEAHLSFIEREMRWIGADGRRGEFVGCVVDLGMATNDWGVPPQYFMSPDYLFRSRYLTDVFLPRTTTDVQGGTLYRWRALDVTGHLRSQMSYRDDPDLWFGYVLRGMEDNDGQETSCTSRLTKITLWVTYVVGAN